MEKSEFGVPGAAGGTADSIIWVRGRKSDGIFFGGSLTFWRVQAGAELREESEAVNESFWDATGVEIEAKQVLGKMRVTG